LHAREHKTLTFLEINVCAHQHFVRPLFQENLQPLHLKDLIAHLGRFGYVHSQRGASAARYDEYPYTVAGSSLLFNDFLELVYSTVC
jgi:hypothetical protein